ncbi:hypothetical protein HKX48_007381 [Thoreauomyces humboldtii]|nr:hypothetical protein HKX48_007381 [Thoreauomyces humboldtii]
MVQCEECMVWQHCECMNVNPKKLPKHYYCEECRPDNHSLYMHQAPKKTTTRSRELAANAAAAAAAAAAPPKSTVREPKKAPAKNTGKKRSTMNSREAAQSYTELLLLRPGTSDRVAASAVGKSPSTDDDDDVEDHHSQSGRTEKVKAPRRRTSQDDSAMARAMRRFSGSQKPEPKVEPVPFFISRVASPVAVSVEADAKTATKRKRRGSIVESADPSVTERPSKRRADSNRDDNRASHPIPQRRPEPVVLTHVNSEHFDKSEPIRPEPKCRKAKVEQPARRPSAQSHTRTAVPPKPARGSTKTVPSTAGSLRKSHQPQQSAPVIAPLSKSPTTSLEKIPPETTLPPKIRIPHARSTIGEMNKRVKQLSDYITRLQVSMAIQTGSPSLTPSPGEGSSQKLMCHLAAVAFDVQNSALETKGATVEGKHPVTAVTGGSGESSFEVLDRLNLSLIRFQEKFGHQAIR